MSGKLTAQDLIRLARPEQDGGMFLRGGLLRGATIYADRVRLHTQQGDLEFWIRRRKPRPQQQQ